MQTKIFIVNGQGSVGKDEFVNFIRQYDKKLFGYERIIHTSMVDRIKFIATMCGWTGAKELKDREFLHDLKILLENYNDLPYSTIVSLIQRNEAMTVDHKPLCPYIFIDAREIKDINRFKKDFNCTTILVKRGESKIFHNEADDEVFNYQYDYVIDNNRELEDLQFAAQVFWDEILKNEFTPSWETFEIEDELEIMEV